MKNLLLLLALGFHISLTTGLNAQKNKSVDLVKSYFKALDGGDAKGLAGFLAPDFQAEAPVSPVPFDAKSWLQFCAGFKAGFPDLDHGVVRIFSNGDQVAVHGILTGTNTGSFMGHPGTGNKVRIAYNTLFTLQKSWVRSVNAQFDLQVFVDQVNGINPMVKMNSESNIRALFAAMDANQPQDIMKYCAADFQIANPFLPSPMPFQAFLEILQVQKTAFPDMQHQVLSMISNGSNVVTQGIFKGTNTGTLMGNPPTGKKVTIPFIAWDNLDASGKIKMRNVQFDNKAFENQLMAGAVSTEQMRSTIQGIYDALNKRDFDRFGAYLAEESIDYATPVPTRGKTAVLSSIKEFFSAFPDYTVELEDIAISGNKVYAKNTFKGTHTQSLMGMIPATGKKIQWSDVDVMEFDSKGKIFAHWAQNPNSPLDQMGYHSITNPNTAVIMDAYSKFGKGDAAGIAGLCKDNVHWDVSDNPALKSPRVYKGQKEVIQFFADLMAACEVTKFEPLRFLGDGDDVTTIISVEWKNKLNHKTLGTTFMHHFKFDQGKIAAFTELTGKPQAIQISASK